jgi:ribosome-associated protein
MTRLVVNSRVEIPLTEFEFTFARSSGPGGQNVNKVASKALLRWNVATSPSLPADIRDRFLRKFGSRLTNQRDLLITSQRYRDQGRNVADCLEKLRAMLAAVLEAPKPRKRTRPGRAAIERRLTTKAAVAEERGPTPARRRLSV